MWAGSASSEKHYICEYNGLRKKFWDAIPGPPKPMAILIATERELLIHRPGALTLVKYLPVKLRFVLPRASGIPLTMELVNF